MLCNISKLAVVAILAALATGCPTKSPPPVSSNTEELKVLTPEQLQFLYDNAERVERSDPVNQVLRNNKGEVTGTTSSKSIVIFLKPSVGGGKFNATVNCTGSCTGTPLLLCLNDNSVCGCKIVTTNNDECSCGTKCGADSNCQGTCQKTITGFGNQGVFITMERGNSSYTSVAQK